MAIRAIVLAAGESRRMGRPKAGLPVRPGGPTFAHALVRTLQSAGLGDVTVVAGAHPAAVREALVGLDAVRVVEHRGWAAGQLSSLLAALRTLETPDLDGILVGLVDSPFVAAETVRLVVDRWMESRAPIVRPLLGDRHGHPVVFDRATFADLHRAPLERGAKAVLEKWAPHVLNVPVDDAGVLADIDTPEDLCAAQAPPRDP
jgi:molybdenum cofactor cytidylyltransferase